MGDSARQGLRERLVVWSVFAVAALTILLSQPYFVGFSPGHHGWVSSHYLAILGHSSPESRWVGYTLGVVEGEGDVHYVYWNRYPTLGSALHKGLTLGLSDGLATRVHISRQFMNAIFVLTMALSYIVLNRLIRRRMIAMATVLFTYSSYYFLYYKDMIFAEQISILASLLLIFAIERFYRVRRDWPLYGLVALALSIGRGFAVLPILVLWVLFELVRRIPRPRETARDPVHSRICATSVRALLLGLALTGASTLYNVAVEASFNRVSMTETSIVEAASRRGGLRPGFNARHHEERAWPAFISGQTDRLRRVFYPVPAAVQKLTDIEVPAKTAVPAIMFLGLLCLIRDSKSRRTPGRRFATLALLLYGVAWLFPARNLAIWHDYTAVYYYGLPLLLYGMIGKRLPRWSAPVLLAGALALFTYNTVEMDARKRELADRYNWITEDFQVISDRLPPGQVVYFGRPYREFLPWAPFASGFYLPDHFVTDDPSLAQYVITDRGNGTDNLTPNNRGIFLSRSRRGTAALASYD